MNKQESWGANNAVTYKETVATLRKLAAKAIFISESDFPPVINPRHVMPYMPGNGIVVPGGLQFLDNQIQMEEKPVWSKIKQILIQETIAVTVWKVNKEIDDRIGQSNIQYVIAALHHEGLILVEIRAVET